MTMNWQQNVLCGGGLIYREWRTNGYSITCAHRTSSASLSGNFVRAVRLCTFHRRVRLLKKGSMLPASNDNFVELAAGKGRHTLGAFAAEWTRKQASRGPTT